MRSNSDRDRAYQDLDALVIRAAKAERAARAFADLAEQFRHANSRSPQVLEHKILDVLPIQAGKLLCECWDRDMLWSLSLRCYYRNPNSDWDLRARFANPVESVYPFAWFAYIRWQLAPVYPERFGDDWKEAFVPEVDRLRLDQEAQPKRSKTAFASEIDDLLWRFDVSADVQATACTILAEELGREATAAKAAVPPEDDNDRRMLLTEAQKLFGFKSPKQLTGFLERHNVETTQPLTKGGKPHKRRRQVSVLDLARAVSRDEKILSDPVRMQRVQTRLQKAQLDKKLENAVFALLPGKAK